jgi:aconitase A
MFGQPIPIRLASIIVGCRLIGQPHFMSTSTDLISALMKVGQIIDSMSHKI